MHTDHRALLMRLITPKRLKENEAFMWELADHQLDLLFSGDGCEYISGYASPFAMLVIADLLGVPREDHPKFAEALLQHRTGGIGSTGNDNLAKTPLEYLYEQFTAYVEDRRSSPQDDVLTGLARATRSEERRVGTECVSPCRSRWSHYH